MLELRPVCENCGIDLPPESTEARICSFECTFCRSCVEGMLCNVCPNCRGGFQPRPARPGRERRRGVSRATKPSTAERKVKPVDPQAHRAFADPVRAVPSRRPGVDAAPEHLAVSAEPVNTVSPPHDPGGVTAMLAARVMVGSARHPWRQRP